LAVGSVLICAYRPTTGPGPPPGRHREPRPRAVFGAHGQKVKNGTGRPVSAYSFNLRIICAHPVVTTRNISSFAAKPVWSNSSGCRRRAGRRGPAHVGADPRLTAAGAAPAAESLPHGLYVTVDGEFHQPHPEP